MNRDELMAVLRSCPAGTVVMVRDTYHGTDDEVTCWATYQNNADGPVLVLNGLVDR